ncbi:MAG: methylamine dehydrogenase light chain [Pseudohongiellaceae bacterium]
MNIDRYLERTFYWVDAQARDSSLLLARRLSRRHFLSRLGRWLAGAALFPLLPVSRAFAQDLLQETGDPQSCDYWRYCAMGGTLCSCCGGTHRSCPPGSEASPIAWVGTCHNPTDGRDYLISYSDCCGKATCSRCNCHNTEGDKPVYYPSNSNSIFWCFGTELQSYHCTVGVVLGEASPETN